MAEFSVVDWSGGVSEITVPRDYNVAVDFVDRNICQGRGDKIAVIDDAGQYTYRDLAERVNRAGNMLLQLGIQQEQRVMICLLDSVDFPATFYGALKIGAIPIATNTLLTARDYDFILRDSRARALVVSQDLLGRLRPILDDQPHLKHVVAAGSSDGTEYPVLDDLLGQAAKELDPAPTTADDAAFWMYSSGTTGQPKGVVHAHADPVHVAALFGQGVLGLTESDVVFSAAKLFFAYGLGNAMTFPFHVGATTVLMAGRPTAETIHDQLVRHQPTVFYGVPTLYAMMLARDDLDCGKAAANLRVCVSAGEALPKDVGLRWKARAGVDILDGIGSTEMLQTFLSNRPDDNRPGTTGKPVPGYEIRLVDDDFRDVEQGEVGELLVKGQSMALCYWNQRQKSRDTFLGPWLRSGDKYFQDRDGYYVYAGRADDMLKVGGIWVSPFELESKLVEHDAVVEAAVIGHADHDDMIKPKAFVVLRNGYLSDPDSGPESRNALAEELKNFLKTSLAAYKYPRWIEFVDELPKTATGKIQRFKLRS
ncbi:MAG: benzoate-CoA ligase family protein [Sphingomonadales bacterium]